MSEVTKPTKVELIPSKRPSGATFYAVACHGSKNVLKEVRRGWILKDFDWVVSDTPAYAYCFNNNMNSIPWTRNHPEYYSLEDAEKLKKFIEENGINNLYDRYSRD